MTTITGTLATIDAQPNLMLTRHFAASAAGAWHLWFELSEDAAATTLTFGQRLNPGEDIGSIGPGWEYYLDRLVAVHAGRDAATVVWDDYYPALQGDYLALQP